MSVYGFLITLNSELKPTEPSKFDEIIMQRVLQRCLFRKVSDKIISLIYSLSFNISIAIVH